MTLLAAAYESHETQQWPAINASNTGTNRLHQPKSLLRPEYFCGAGHLIGGGPRAFQKYKSGDLLPSHAVASALILLDNDPASLRLLRQKQKRKASSVEHSSS